MKTMKKNITVGVLVIITALSVVTVVLAAVIGIDAFSSGAQNLTISVIAPATSNSGTSVVPSITGSIDTQRDIYLAVTTPGSADRNATVQVIPGETRLSLSTDDGVSTVFMQIEWDGTDGTANSINPIGLQTAGVGKDLVSSSPANIGIRIRVLSHDVAGTLKMIVYTDSTSCSQRTLTLPGNMIDQILDFTFAFSAFTTETGCSSPATFTNVGAMVLQVAST